MAQRAQQEFRLPATASWCGMDLLHIDLNAFQGPLDLLLHLVREEEVDVHDIPVARIADRFLDICRTQVERLDVDHAADFLVMASHLLVLKSRALLPREVTSDLEDLDPRLDLVRMLLEYRRYREVSEQLSARAEERRDLVPVRVTSSNTAPAEEPLEVDLFALVSAFQRLLAETGDDQAVIVPKERLPITHFVSRIFDRLLELGGRVTFQDLLGGPRERSYVIGAFLALLELIKLRKVRAVQDGVGEIQIEISDAPPAEGEGESAAQTLLLTETEEEGMAGPRIVFMGSPDFALPSLRTLVRAGLRPKLVVTPPPKPTGRGRRVRPVPVARLAEDLGLPLHRTTNVNSNASVEEVAATRPDLIVTAGFGQRLGRALLDLPRHGCLNLHASLLPRHRGASPVYAAIRAGDANVGVSVFHMTARLDEGPVLGHRGLLLGDHDTLDETSARLAEIGADLLVQVIRPWCEGTLEPAPQDPELATYAPRLRKEDGIVDWSQDARGVHNQVRAVTSWPGAQAAWRPQVKHPPLDLVLVRTQVAADALPGTSPPGTVLAVHKDEILVACGRGQVRVLALRPVGGRTLKVRDFLNARRIAVGDRFVGPQGEQPASS